jgi:hypothetical protein
MKPGRPNGLPQRCSGEGGFACPLAFALSVTLGATRDGKLARNTSGAR